MKGLKKLAIASAVSMISVGAFAMEAMDDQSMSSATGQDGITILVSPGAQNVTDLTSTTVGTGYNVSAATAAAIDLASPGNTSVSDGIVKGLTVSQIVVHDDDGFGALTNSGAIVIGDGTTNDATVVFADNTSAIVIDIDSVGDADTVASGNQAMLNVAITTPKLAIKTGAIYVADSNAVTGATNADITGDVDGTSHSDRTKILNAMELILGATTINIQLGAAESQGAMIAVNASIVGGLTINNLALNDNNSGGSILASSMSVKDNGGANLTANVAVNATSASGGGLAVNLVGLGSAGGIDIAMNDVTLGTAANANLGDVQIIGLNLNGTTLLIRGH